MTWLGGWHITNVRTFEPHTIQEHSRRLGVPKLRANRPTRPELWTAKPLRLQSGWIHNSLTLHTLLLIGSTNEHHSPTPHTPPASSPKLKPFKLPTHTYPKACLGPTHAQLASCTFLTWAELSLAVRNTLSLTLPKAKYTNRVT